MSLQVSSDVKAIIWDLDGTVINSFGIFYEITSELAPQFGKPVPSEETALQNYHGSLRDSIHSVFGGGMADDELDAALDAFLERQHAYYESIDGHLIEDAIDLSKRVSLKELKQVIVTNRDHEGRGKASPREIVAGSVLKELIHAVVCGDDGPYRKPDPRVLEGFLEKEGLKGGQLLVVGDQFVDAQFALNLGAQGVIVGRDGIELAHSHLLDDGWQRQVSVVKNLNEVVI